MPGLAGRPGSWGGLLLRVGQAVFAGACVGVMGSSTGFANYSAFCYLVASMGMQSLWSLGLACLDGYALKAKKDLTRPILVSMFIVGDWVTAILSYAASCSAAGVVVLFRRDVLFCRRYPQAPCGKYEIATALAFIAWAFSATSAIVMFWLLAST